MRSTSGLASRPHIEPRQKNAREETTMKSIRTRLWLGGSGAAMTAALLSVPAAALAQATPTAHAPGAPASTDQVEEIVVTGIRASLRSAMDVKRNSLQVVDTISAEDIGDFPDKNLSEPCSGSPACRSAARTAKAGASASAAPIPASTASRSTAPRPCR
jgi:hypothetical protein